MEHPTGVNLHVTGTGRQRPTTTLVDPLLAEVTRASRDGVALLVGERIEWVNGPLADLTGRRAESLVGKAFTDLVVQAMSADGRHPAIDLGGLRHASGTATGRLLRIGLAPVPVSVEASRLGWDEEGWALTFRELSHLTRVEAALAEAESHFEAVARRASEGLIRSGHGAQLRYVSDRFAAIWEQPADHLLGIGWLGPVHPDDLDELYQAIESVLEGRHAELELRITLADRQPRPVRLRLSPVARADRSIGFVGSADDLTTTEALEATLTWHTGHDALTGLLNRSELLARLDALVARGGEPVAVVQFDIDEFSTLNARVGQAACDEILRGVADRLLAATGAEDVVSRPARHEFVVVLTGPAATFPKRTVARILDDLEDPFHIAGGPVRLSFATGIAHGGPSAAQLLDDADDACERAGRSRNGIEVVDEQQRAVRRRTADITNGLRSSIRDENITVAYQPILDTANGRIIGAEALLRYDHPAHGPIDALEAVQVAEARGDIAELGRCVLRTALRDLATWRQERGQLAPDYVAVNLSAAQLDDDGLLQGVLAALHRNSLLGSDLCLELTESQLMTDVERATAVLGELHDLGVRIAIDDFGTGYSSLSHLRSLPVDIVKLDRCFIADTDDDPTGAAIVGAVTGMADALGFDVTAEGIENGRQLRWITGLGCSHAQGYALGRPTTPDLFPQDTPWT